MSRQPVAAHLLPGQYRVTDEGLSLANMNVSIALKGMFLLNLIRIQFDQKK